MGRAKRNRAYLKLYKQHRRNKIGCTELRDGMDALPDLSQDDDEGLLREILGLDLLTGTPRTRTATRRAGAAVREG